MVSKSIRATYDGITFHPVGALDLKPDTEYLFTIEEIKEEKKQV